MHAGRPAESEDARILRELLIGVARKEIPTAWAQTDSELIANIPRELRAAKQVLGSLSSNVDQAMMRPSFAAGSPPQDDSSSSSSNSSQASADVDDELVSPKKAIRGIAAGGALRKRLAKESASSLA